MVNNIKNNFGITDQDILLMAFAKYLEKVTGNQDTILLNVIKSCVVSVMDSDNITFNDIQYLNKSRRMGLVIKGVQEFMKRINGSHQLKEKLTADGIRIYYNWKKTRYRAPSIDDMELREMIDELTQGGFFT